MRDYYGRHYPGQFHGLSTAIMSHGRGQEDSIILAERIADEKYQEHYKTCSMMERFTRRVYKALETEYTHHPERRADITPHLVYWAKRLRHFQGRDWEVTCFED